LIRKLFFLLIIYLVTISINLTASDKLKILIVSENFNKTDLLNEKNIYDLMSESLNQKYDVVYELEAYKYMIPGGKVNCKTGDINCTFKLVEPLLKKTQDCLSSNNGKSEKCYTNLLKKYDSNFLIINNFKKQDSKVQIKSTLFRNSSNNLEIENIFDKSILEFQSDYYLKEIPKFLFDNKYVINIPNELLFKNEKVNLNGLQIETFNKLDIEIYKFVTADELADAMIEEQKAILKQGDSLFQNGEYSRAKNIYNGIIKAIDVGLRPEIKLKVTKYVSGLKSRIGLCDVNEFLKLVNSNDKKFSVLQNSANIDVLLEIIREYKNLSDLLDGNPFIDKPTKNKVKIGLNSRIKLLFNPIFNSWQKRAEQIFYQLKFNEAIEEYNNIINEIQRVVIDEKDKSNLIDKYNKSIDNVRINGKKLLANFIRSRSNIAERKNINYISQYFIEEKIENLKIYLIISDNISKELLEILNNNEYREYLDNNLKKYYNRVAFQINQSRLNHSDTIKLQYSPYYSFIDRQGIEFNYIPGLESVKECDISETNCSISIDGKKVKIIKPKSFYISKYEVSQNNWLNIMDPNFNKTLKEIEKKQIGNEKIEQEVKDYIKKSSFNPSYFKECGRDCPIENINITEIEIFINSYCAKNNYGSQNCPYRLPTNSEWEYSAKGWENDSYAGLPFNQSNDDDLGKIANFGGNCTVAYGGSYNLLSHSNTSYNPISIFSSKPIDFSFYKSVNSENKEVLGDKNKCGTNEVGKKTPNFFSLYDMAGNVGEWCVLNYKNNSYGVCGGSWALKSEYQKSEYLTKIEKNIKNPTIGFRLIYMPKE
jgi:formylglycine-generating enzyme required for sulfatase activity